MIVEMITAVLLDNRDGTIITVDVRDDRWKEQTALDDARVIGRVAPDAQNPYQIIEWRPYVPPEDPPLSAKEISDFIRDWEPID